jgi:hypothetical protein
MFYNIKNYTKKGVIFFIVFQYKSGILPAIDLTTPY